MGSHSTKPSNKSMVDRLVEQHCYIRTPLVEGAFRAVDRAMYFDLEEGEVINPYDDDPWRRGNLHLSAPNIYAKVVESLDLKPGLSFLNLGSGTGYLNTIIGLLVGSSGINHGIEYHPDVVEYACKRLQKFMKKSHAIDKYDFAEPVFITGNCINLNPDSKYDRIYLGAACLPDLENFMKKLIKPNGGILVMPYENHLMRYVRTAETEWKTEKLMDVNFTSMIRQSDDIMINMPLAQAMSLKELCRRHIRRHLRDKTNLRNPNLLHSDNILSRRLRKAKAERKYFGEEIEKDFSYLQGRDGRGNRQKNRDCNHRCRRDRPDSMNRDEAGVPETGASIITKSNRNQVMTRSASRRLASGETSNTSTADNRPVSDQRIEDVSVSNDASSLSTSSDSDQDDTRHNNRARGRERSSAARNQSLAYLNDSPRPPLPYRSGSLGYCLNGPPALTLQRQIASLINPSSSSASSSDSDLGDIQEYDYVGRQVVLGWPGNWLRIPISDGVDGPGLIDIRDDSISSSSLSSSSESDNSDANDNFPDDDSYIEANLESFYEDADNFEDSLDEDSDSLSTVTSRFPSRTEFSGEDDDPWNSGIRRDCPIDPVELLFGQQPQPSTSNGELVADDGRSNNRRCNTLSQMQPTTSNRSCNKSSGDLQSEPVARRLRSKDAPLEPATSSNIKPEHSKPLDHLDRPVPSCSRDQLANDRFGHRSDCPTRHKCRPVSDSKNQQRQRNHNHLNRSRSSNQTSSTQNTESEHSSMRLSSAEPSINGATTQILITPSLAATLSLASRQYRPSSHHHQHKRSDQRMTPDRRLASSSGNRRQHRRHSEKLDRKRKRHSSSESSEASGSCSSPSRQKSNRRCTCLQTATGTQIDLNNAGRSEQATSIIVDESEDTFAAQVRSAISAARSSFARASGGLARGSRLMSRARRNETDIPLPAPPVRQPEDGSAAHRYRSQNSSAENAATSNLGSFVGQQDPSQSGPSSNNNNNNNHQRCFNSRSQQRRSDYLHCRHCRTAQKANSRLFKEIECRRQAERKRRLRKRHRRNECERYYNHMRGYISQLDLPRVLHSYLNYDRKKSN